MTDPELQAAREWHQRCELAKPLEAEMARHRQGWRRLRVFHRWRLTNRHYRLKAG